MSFLVNSFLLIFPDWPNYFYRLYKKTIGKCCWSFPASVYCLTNQSVKCWWSGALPRLSCIRLACPGARARAHWQTSARIVRLPFIHLWLCRLSHAPVYNELSVCGGSSSDNRYGRVWWKNDMITFLAAGPVQTALGIEIGHGPFTQIHCCSWMFCIFLNVFEYLWIF